MKEFEKWFAKSTIRDIRKSYCRGTWKAALRMIKSEGVISDYELAGKIIKDELEE